MKSKRLRSAARLALLLPVLVGDAIASLAAQELNRMLAATEVQVAALKARVGEYSSRVAAAREALKTAPQLEAEAAQLNRDHEINKKNYQDLVSRRQAAIMSGELEVASGVADFRLIDPPRVTPQPVAPNRLLLLPLALVAALGVGLFVAFAASQLRPVYSDGNELRTKTSLPLLGVVSLVMNDGDRRRERQRDRRGEGSEQRRPEGPGRNLLAGDGQQQPGQGKKGKLEGERTAHGTKKGVRQR